MRATRVSARTLREVTADLRKEDRDEMAVPSYTHPNPLIRWLFWSRLDAALELAGLRPGLRVLDFASGSGVLLPSLVAAGCRVAATDPIPTPWMRHARASRLPIEPVPFERLAAWAGAREGTIDVVFALDVLEHVSDEELPALSFTFARLLGADGLLVTSGATETIPYRIARALAGFKGEYHHRSIFDVHRALEPEWIRIRRRDLPPHPLPHGFVISSYRPRVRGQNRASSPRAPSAAED